MISDRHISNLALGVTAIVAVLSVYGMGKQVPGSLLMACLAGVGTLIWGRFVRWHYAN